MFQRMLVQKIFRNFSKNLLIKPNQITLLSKGNFSSTSSHNLLEQCISNNFSSILPPKLCSNWDESVFHQIICEDVLQGVNMLSVKFSHHGDAVEELDKLLEIFKTENHIYNHFRAKCVLLMGCSEGTEDQRERQLLLAKLTELVHLSILLHQKVANVDKSADPDRTILRNKLTVVLGDYVLAKICTQLVELQNPDITLMYYVIIENLSKSAFYGELNSEMTDKSEDDSYQFWLEKNFTNLPSLFAHSFKATIQLTSADSLAQTAAFEFGKNFALFLVTLKQIENNKKAKQEEEFAFLNGTSETLFRKSANNFQKFTFNQPSQIFPDNHSREDVAVEIFRANSLFTLQQLPLTDEAKNCFISMLH